MHQHPQAHVVANRPWFRLGWLGLLALTISGCGSQHPEYFGTIKPKHGPNELWINNGGEPEWIDPNKCSDSNGGEIIFNTFAGLVEAHPESLEPMPDIATHWDVADGGRRYTFHLRPTKWSDGTPLTAHDFEYSFKRLLDHRTASKYATNGHIFKNGEAANLRAIMITGLPDGATPAELEQWADGLPVKSPRVAGEVGFLFVKSVDDLKEEQGESNAEAEPEPVDREAVIAQLRSRPLTAAGTTVEPKLEVTSLAHVGAKAIDDLTLEIELENPIPYFLRFLTFYSFMPVPRHVIERLEAERKNPDLWTRPEHVACNGPYKMTEWKFRQYMIFEKNPEYWNPSSVKVDKIRLLMIESYNTALNMYKAGELDWPGSNTPLPNEFMEPMKQYKDFHFAPNLAVYFYWLNTKRPPLDNPKLRRALSLSVNRQDLVDHVTQANQIPSQDLVPDGLAGYEGLNRPVYDPDGARQMLKEAGYESGADVPPITLTYNTSEGHKQIAEAIQQMWKKELGIAVTIENQEWNVYLKNTSMMNFQIGRMGWIGDYADPFTFLELLTTECGNNHSNWSNAEYDALLRQANQQTDAKKRLSLMRQAEALAMEQQPMIPLYVYTKTQMIKPYLRGIWNNYQDRHPWKYIWIDEQYYDGLPETPLPAVPPPDPAAALP